MSWDYFDVSASAVSRKTNLNGCSISHQKDLGTPSGTARSIGFDEAIVSRRPLRLWLFSVMARDGRAMRPCIHGCYAMGTSGVPVVFASGGRLAIRVRNDSLRPPSRTRT